ncbi:MAG: hypothetical protein N4A49_11020 [Marinifilaceae bacterium]|jgi:hypothetical protein|nr:hypothetical protein [Marinifilaceae bacterium]
MDNSLNNSTYYDEISNEGTITIPNILNTNKNLQQQKNEENQSEEANEPNISDFKNNMESRNENPYSSMIYEQFEAQEPTIGENTERIDMSSNLQNLNLINSQTKQVDPNCELNKSTEIESGAFIQESSLSNNSEN